MSESPPREPDDHRTSAVPVRERTDGYVRNGVWVPRDAEPDPQPPSWWEQLEARWGIRRDDRRWWVAAGGVLLLLVVVVVVAATREGAPPRKPEQQRDFLAAVERGQRQVRAGNDITLVTADRQRSSQACRHLPGGKVHGWIGTLTKVGTVFGGDQGQVTVSLGHDVTLHTWSHQSQDAKDHTLVDSHSDVYQVLADLDTGDRVVFDGTFVPEGGACLHETSLFARNGMLTPGFVFRFTAVAPG